MDADVFRKCLGKFPTGIAVVTVFDAARGIDAMVVNSFTSVSLSPPLILWCLRRQSRRYATFAHVDRFGVSVLTGQHEELVRATDGLTRAERYEVGVTGVPLLRDACAVLECATHDRLDGGDHTIMLGRVEAVDMADRPPLLWFESAVVTNFGNRMRARTAEAGCAE